MGDTFQDEWESDIPREFSVGTLVWELVDVQNTKWEGNRYTYRHKDRNVDHEWELIVRSLSPRSVLLVGEICIRDRTNRRTVDLTVTFEEEWNDFEPCARELAVRFEATRAALDRAFVGSAR